MRSLYPKLFVSYAQPLSLAAHTAFFKKKEKITRRFASREVCEACIPSSHRISLNRIFEWKRRLRKKYAQLGCA